MTKVFINSVGLNNALGASVAEISKTLFTPGANKLEVYDNLFSGRQTWVGRVKASLPELPKDLWHWRGRNNQLALDALLQIEGEIEAAIEEFGNTRVACILGTSTSGIEEGEKDAKGQSNSFSYLQQEIGNLSQFISSYLGLKGPSMTVSTACSSSSKAIISAVRMICTGMVDAAIVGGSDSLCELTLNGFDSLESLSVDQTNPFSRNRKGINIGEGAAFMLISSVESPVEIIGFGESSDAHHISAPHPEGQGGQLAIAQALGMAGIDANDIGYVNLHGTGTRQNDLMESKLVNQTFGEDVLVSSTKPMIGHCLGSSGSQELAFCYMCLNEEINSEKKLPSHFWDGEVDPELAKINFVNKTSKLAKKYVMSNSFAFGGSNASLILRG